MHINWKGIQRSIREMRLLKTRHMIERGGYAKGFFLANLNLYSTDSGKMLQYDGKCIINYFY